MDVHHVRRGYCRPPAALDAGVCLLAAALTWFVFPCLRRAE